MRKLLILISFIATTSMLSSQSDSSYLYGYWLNLDKELLTIQPNNTFVRQTATNPSTIISRGTLEVKNNELYVVRTDTGETYTLKFHVSENIFVVTKPGTDDKVWLFERLWIKICGVEQMEARWAHNPEVVGSNPTPATTLS